jgi:hypothetical protein
MTGRDRIVVMVIAAVVIVGAAYLLVVSPERKKASGLATQVAAAKAQLAAAEGTLQNARAAQQQYAKAYSSIVTLGKAVPASQEIPSLIYQLEQASNKKKVEFNSIAAGSGSTSPASASGSSGSSAASAAATAAAFTPLSFTFVFNGSFFDLQHLFQQVDRFVLRTPSGLRVNGRLLTVQSVRLAPKAETGTNGKPSTALTGTITATAYVLPASQGLTGGATPSAPSGSAPAPSTGASSSPTAPAVARVTP